MLKHLRDPFHNTDRFGRPVKHSIPKAAVCAIWHAVLTFNPHLQLSTLAGLCSG